MLDATPRPLPPAKARRASVSHKSTPPPPYIATPSASRPELSHRIPDWEKMRLSIPVSSPVTEDWLNEHAHGDLTQLLTKAGQVIKERESGTSHTQATLAKC